ncbi:MAG: hypothetical protein CM1200mP30_16750 [Pseudomonadota bacterium]|nr:MAG: hypothetical protein CM1200mP30_16750 [Pseudomonadota bacterium]
MLVLDQCRQMFFGSRKRLKSVQPARIAALMGWRALLRGDRVGAFYFQKNSIMNSDQEETVVIICVCYQKL